MEAALAPTEPRAAAQKAVAVWARLVGDSMAWHSATWAPLELLAQKLRHVTTSDSLAQETWETGDIWTRYRFVYMFFRGGQAQLEDLCNLFRWTWDPKGFTEQKTAIIGSIVYMSKL